MLAEVFLLTHGLPWQTRVGDFIQFVIILFSVNAIFRECFRAWNDPSNIKRAVGVSVLSITLAGLIVGLFSYVYITFWNPDYERIIAMQWVREGEPYKTGTDSEGPSFAAGFVYSSKLVVFLKTLLFTAFGLLSALMVAAIYRFKRRRASR